MAKNIVNVDRNRDNSIDRMRQQMNDLFDNFFRGGPLGFFDEPEWSLSPGGDFRVPTSDVYETDDAYVINVETPGMDKNDVKVEMDDNTLTIRAEKTQEQKDDQKKGYFRSERSYTGFYRQFPLPEGVDSENIKAQYNNGVLEVIVPKTEERKRNVKQIDIE